MFKDEEFINLTNSIKEAQKENLQSTVEIYNKIHRNIPTKFGRRCSCEIATTYIGPYRHGFSLTKSLYLRKIEREFTHDDCLKFELMNSDFLQGNIGIKEAAKFYFNKTLNQLNEEEKIMFIVMLENASLYNPMRRKEKVEAKVRVYKALLNKKTGL
jgi:penicillin-binding protein 1A